MAGTSFEDAQQVDDTQSIRVSITGDQFFSLGNVSPGTFISVLPDWAVFTVDGNLYSVVPEVVSAPSVYRKVVYTDGYGVTSTTYQYAGALDEKVDVNLKALFPSAAFGGVDPIFNGSSTIWQVPEVQSGPFVGKGGSIVGNYKLEYTNEYYLQIAVQPLSSFIDYTFSNRYLIAFGDPEGQRNSEWGSWLNRFELYGSTTTEDVLARLENATDVITDFFDANDFRGAAVRTSSEVLSKSLSRLDPGKVNLLSTMGDLTKNESLLGAWTTTSEVSEALTGSRLKTAAGHMGTAVTSITSAFELINEYKQNGDLLSAVGKGSTSLLAGLVAGEAGTIVGTGATVLAVTFFGGTGLPIIAGLSVGLVTAGVVDYGIRAAVGYGSHFVDNLFAENLRFSSSSVVIDPAEQQVAGMAALTAPLATASSGLELGMAPPIPKWSYDPATDEFTWLEMSSIDKFYQAQAALGVSEKGGAGLTVAGDSYQNIINDYIVGSPLADNLAGGLGDDVLVGGNGADQLQGDFGTNVLFGEDGEDVFVSGSGLDTFDGGPGLDTADYSQVLAALDLDLEREYGKWPGADGDRLISIENVIGTRFNDYMAGTVGANTISGGQGDDELAGGAGTDFLIGGDGYDTAAFVSLTHNYNLNVANGAGVVTGGSEGTLSTLLSIENIKFRDASLTFSADSDAAFVMRLYDSVHGRAPDAVGLDYWLDSMSAGTTRSEVAANFINSPEFAGATGSLSTSAYVEYLYTSSLGRGSDSAGMAYWVNQIEAGASRAAVLLNFSESAEHRALTADALDGGLWITDNNYQQVAALYDALSDRLPDQNGLNYWVDSIESGMSLSQVASSFAASAEFASETAGFSSGDLVDFMYENTLERPSDAGGKSYWTAQVDAGLSKGDLLLNFSSSAEHFQQLEGQLFSGVDFYI